MDRTRKVQELFSKRTYLFWIWSLDSQLCIKPSRKTSKNVFHNVVYSDETSKDVKPPVTSLVTYPWIPNGENGWFTTDVELQLLAKDDMLSSNITTYYPSKGF